jgi:serine/threonine protein kinase
MWQILYALSVCFSHNIIHKDIRPENFLIDGDELTLIDFRLAQFVKEKPKFMTRQSMICKSSPLEAVCLKSIDSLPDEDENEIRMIRSGTNFKKIEDFEDQKKNPLRLNMSKIPSKEDKSPNEIIVPHKKFGQVHYRAPETFIKEYYYQSDIWSAGVIFYILCTGNLPPFNLQGNNKKASKIQLSDREYYADTPRFSTAPKSKKKSDADTEDFAFIDEIHSDILSEEGKDLMKKMFNQYHYLRISAPFAMRHTYFKKEESYKEVNIDQIKKTIINCVNNSQVCDI